MLAVGKGMSHPPSLPCSGQLPLGNAWEKPSWWGPAPALFQVLASMSAILLSLHGSPAAGITALRSLTIAHGPRVTAEPVSRPASLAGLVCAVGAEQQLAGQPWGFRRARRKYPPTQLGITAFTHGHVPQKMHLDGVSRNYIAPPWGHRQIIPHRQVPLTPGLQALLWWRCHTNPQLYCSCREKCFSSSQSKSFLLYFKPTASYLQWSQRGSIFLPYLLLQLMYFTISSLRSLLPSFSVIFSSLD